jgi:anti-anti-sigma factor
MIIKLPENLTQKNARELRQSLSSIPASECATIVFDFSQVREMDNAAVELLLQCMNQIAQNDGTVRISGMSAEAAIFLELTRMDSVFAIFEGRPVTVPTVAAPDFAVPAVRNNMQVTAA